MFENRSLRSDLFALGLCVLTLFLGASLVTYNPSDPVREALRNSPLSAFVTPDVLVYPVGQQFTNACGRWGAVASHLTFGAFGLGCFYLLLSLLVVDFALLRRRTIDAPMVRLTGWLATLLGITTLLSTFLPGLGPAPVVGAGGYLGAMGRSFVDSHFAMLGGFILTVSLTVGGMLLCTDYWVVRGVVVAGRLLLLLVFYRKSFVRSDTPEADSESSPAGSRAAVAVKIQGKKRAGRSERGDLDDDLVAGATAVIAAPVTSHDEDGLLDEEEEEEDVDSVDDEDDSGDEEDEEEDEELDGVDEPSRAQPLVTKLTVVPGKSAKTAAAAPAPHFRIKRTADGLDRDQVLAELDQASQGGPSSEYELPSLELLIPGEDLHYEAQEKEVRRKAKILEKTFLDFGFRVRVVEIETGPVIAQYEVELEAGLRLSKITGLADDLAIALRVPSVRIVAPIPGKNTVGIEVPNEERQVVRM